jgi:hypothetical protein
MRGAGAGGGGGGVAAPAAWRQRWAVPNGSGAVVAHTLSYSSRTTATPAAAAAAAATMAGTVGRAGGAPASSSVASVGWGWWRGPGSSWSSPATVRRGVWAGAACGLLLVLPGGRHVVKASQVSDASAATATSSEPAVVRLYSPAVATPLTSSAAPGILFIQLFIQLFSYSVIYSVIYFSVSSALCCYFGVVTVVSRGCRVCVVYRDAFRPQAGVHPKGMPPPPPPLIDCVFASLTPALAGRRLGLAWLGGRAGMWRQNWEAFLVGLLYASFGPHPSLPHARAALAAAGWQAGRLAGCPLT